VAKQPSKRATARLQIQLNRSVNYLR